MVRHRATTGAMVGGAALALMALAGCGGGGASVGPQARDLATISIPVGGVRPVLADGNLVSVTVAPDGAAHYTTDKTAGDLTLPSSLTTKLYQDLQAAMPLSGLDGTASPCISPQVQPPTVAYGGQQTDFHCSGYADPQSRAGVLYADAQAVLSAVADADPSPNP